MERLHFGARARKRAQRQKYKKVAVVLWLAACAAGVPGATAVLDWMDEIQHRAPVAATRPDTEPSAASKEAMAALSEIHIERRAETASPSPSIAAIESSSPVLAAIYDAAAEFGLDGDYLVSVAECESGLSSTAYNPAGYHGLFQFDESTWSAYGYGSIYDPVAQARTAARLIADGQSSRWPNCA